MKNKNTKSYKKYAKGARKNKLVTAYKDSHSFKFGAVNCGLQTTAVAGIAGIVPVGPVRINVTQSVIGGASSYNVAGIFDFNFANTLNARTMGTLFDRYRINAIKIKVMPGSNINNFAGTGIIPEMRVVHDYDDSSIPTVGDVWSRRGKTYRLDKPFNIYLKPKVASGVWNGATSTAYAVTKAPFLNATYASVPHYGIKFAIKDYPAFGNTQLSTVRFEMTYLVTLKEQILVSQPDSVGQPLNDHDVVPDGTVLEQNQQF